MRRLHNKRDKRRLNRQLIKAWSFILNMAALFVATKKKKRQRKRGDSGSILEHGEMFSEATRQIEPFKTNCTCRCRRVYQHGGRWRDELADMQTTWWICWTICDLFFFLMLLNPKKMLLWTVNPLTLPLSFLTFKKKTRKTIVPFIPSCLNCNILILHKTLNTDFIRHVKGNSWLKINKKS